MYRGKGSSRQLVGVLFKEPLSSEACVGRVEAAAFHHTYLRAGNMKNGGGQGITESQHLMHALKRLDTKEGYFGRKMPPGVRAVPKKKRGEPTTCPSAKRRRALAENGPRVLIGLDLACALLAFAPRAGGGSPG